MKAANLALRFALELCAFAALGYWGSQGVSGPVRWAIELVVFVGAAVALVAAGQAVLGIALGVIAVANGAILRATC